MISSRTVEILVGLFVALGLAALFFLAVRVSNLSSLAPQDGYTVNARFDNIGGLTARSPVKAAGVKVGEVASIDYSQDEYRAVVTLAIDGQYDRFPLDTSASVYTAGLLGEQYIGLEPGADFDYLKQGDTIEITSSAVILERLIGQFLYSQSGNGGSSGGGS